MTQLNATANVAGAFVYSPAAATTLSVGSGQTLSVTFTPTDTVNYTTATKSVTIDVSRATPVVTWANPAAITYGMALGATQLNATTSVAGTWLYTPAAGTTLDAGAGQVLGVTFTPTDTANYTTATKTVTIDVGRATPTITWAAPAGITYGAALSGAQLNATASVPGTLIYTPAAGTVLNAGAGQVLSVTLTPTDTANYAPATATVTIDVGKITSTVTWAAPAGITYGTPLTAAQLNAAASGPGTFVYTPAAGTVLIAGAGQVLSVTFTPTDAVNYETATATVTLAVGQATPVVTWVTPAAVNYGTALSGVQLNATANVAGTFVYTPPSGTAMNTVGPRVLSVAFTPTDSANYAAATAAVSIDVGKATPTITWPTPAAVSYGTVLGVTQLNATANVAGTFVYTPPAGTVMHTVGSQALAVTFTPTDPANYTTATAAATIEVTKATPTVTWAPPASVVTGTALSGTQLNATANVSGAFVYSPAAGTVVTVGTQTLSTTFTPTDVASYATATASVAITVRPFVGPSNGGGASGNISGSALIYHGVPYPILNGRVNFPDCTTYIVGPNGSLMGGANTPNCTPTGGSGGGGLITPTITWATPASVVVGTALSGMQLNAAATASGGAVAGSFVYTPPAGTVMNAVGTQTLAVVFTPTDGATYTSAAESVTLAVTAVDAFVGPANGGGWSGTISGSNFLYRGGTYPIVNGRVNFPDCTTYIVGPNGSLMGGSATPSCMPALTWATPAAITYGTALSGTHLNATATANGSPLAGTYSYTPVAGTVLNGGAGQTLSVTFTPTDLEHYALATKTVTIDVSKVTPAVTWVAPAAIRYGTALGAAQLNATANVAGTFTYTPATGTVLNGGAGQVLSVVFTPTATANYTTATTTVSIDVTAATPTMTWATPAGVPVGTALSATQLNATASVPGTFFYSPGAGAALTLGAQTLSATFTPTNQINYATATATVTIEVGKITPTLTWATPASIPYGTALGAAQLNATASVPGTFAYTPAAGTVLNGGVGQALSVTFTPTDTASYTVSTATVAITVGRIAPTIAWATPAAIPYGTALGAAQLNATASVPGTMAYTPPAGTVLNGGIGQALSVSFTPTDAINYTTATKSVALDVTKATPTVTWATPPAVVVGTVLGAAQLSATASVPGTWVYAPAAGTVLTTMGSHALSGTFTPTNATNYTTATASVSLTVNAFVGPANGGGWAGTISGTNLVYNGVPYPIGNGRVNFPDCTTYIVGPNGALMGGSPTPNCTPAGSGAAPTITWATPTAIPYGTALSGAQLNATASVPGTFVYTPAAGTVPNAGVGQLLSATFTPTDLVTYRAVTATVTLGVGRATPTITWATPAAIPYGTALSGTQLNATASVAGTWVYSPAAGTTLSAGAGQVLGVTFTPNDTTNYTSATATVALDVTRATPTITWARPVGVPVGTVLGATQLNATSNAAGTFVYTPAAGTVLPLGPQTLSATITPTDTANYTTATATVTLEVGKITPTLTWATPAAVPYGPALSGAQLNATASVAGTLVYTPAAGTVLNAGAGQILSVTFTPTDTASYTTATTSVAIDVTRVTPTLTWATPAAISYGTALGATQLNAAASVPGTLVYSPAAGVVLSGGAGQTLSVTVTPTDAANYTGTTATVTIDVTKATPTITWANPASVVHGTLLGGTQLNATASVPGTFAYSPVAGTVLTVGMQTLSTTFTPTAASNYTTATATVNMTVRPFVGPSNGGGWTGTVSGSNLIYNGVSYPIGNGRVNFPDCTTYIVGPNGSLMGGSNTPNCTPTGGSSGGGLITPAITWPTPAAVTLGTALSATQLNATATASGSTVAGTFVYTPALGTVMNTAGSQTLSVVFTPTNGVTYTAATESVTLVVRVVAPFVGPANGGGWSGTISGSNLVYNDVSYPIVNGRVSFPDCTMYIVGPNGALMGGSAIPNCTPSDRR